MNEAPDTRRSRRKHEIRQHRAVTLAPIGQLLPGLPQFFLGHRIVGALGLISCFAGLAAILVLVVGFLVDRRIGLGWATQEGPLTVILVVAFVLGLVWVALGIHLAVVVWNRKPRESHRALRSALVVLVAALQLIMGGTIAYYANLQREFVGSLFPTAAPTVTEPQSNDAIQPPPLPPPPAPEGRVNILMLGGDAGEGRWGLRPDSISVVSVDLATAQTTIIGVPRNLQLAPFSEGSPLYGPWPNGYDCGASCLISYLYTYASGRPGLYPGAANPGVEATRDAVEGVLGIEIPYAILIDMQGFTDLIDAIGGIDLCVSDRILSDSGAEVIVEAGCQHMDGATALTYSRARHDSDDYGRMTKQRAVQEALLAQADPITVLQNFQKLTSAGAEYIYTDIPQTQLGVLLDAALRGQGKSATTLELVPPKFSSVHPDFDAFHYAVKEVLGEE